jgi:hypothetical protein
MGMWYDNPTVTTMSNSDDKEEVGAESGYHSDRGQTRESLGWATGALRVVKVVEEIGKEDSDSSCNDGKKKGKGDGEKLFQVKASGRKDDSPAKNLRKMSVQSPVVKRGNKGSRRWCR